MSQKNIINKIKTKQNEIFILSTFVIMTLIFASSLYYIKLHDNTINDDFLVAFKGELNNNVYSTYLYENKKKVGNKTKIEYKYINTTLTTQLDSTNYVEKVTKKGTIKKKRKIFEIAEKNHAFNILCCKYISKL